MIDHWYESWKGLKERRILAAVSVVVWLGLWIAFGPAGLLIGFLLAFGAYIRLRAFPCPRCHLPVVGVRRTSFPDRCEGCGLRIFGHEYDVADYARIPNVFTMSRRLRRTIAGYEMASGVVLMLLSAFARVPFWAQITLEGLAAFSLAGGWWLWRDDARGYALTRTLQLIQLIRIQSSVLVYLVTAGIAIDVQSMPGANLSLNSLNAAFNTELKLRLGAGLPLGVAINLWAAAIFLMLLHARPAPAQAVAVTAVSPATVPAAPSVDGTLPPVGAEP